MAGQFEANLDRLGEETGWRTRGLARGGHREPVLAAASLDARPPWQRVALVCLPPVRASPASPLLLLPPLPLSHPQGVAVAQGSPCILPPFLMQSEEREVSPRVVASGPPLFPQLLIPGPLLGFVS